MRHKHVHAMRLAVVDGEEVKYRIIEVTPGKKYHLQKLVPAEEVDEDEPDPPKVAKNAAKKQSKAAAHDDMSDKEDAASPPPKKVE